MSNQKSQRKIKYIFIGNKPYEVINGFTTRNDNTMNKEQAKRMLPIIKAFSEGMQIQIKRIDKWETLTEGEGLPINTFTDEPNNFRIKPEPKYRPFKNAEECWQEMQKHQPFGWVKAPHGYFAVTGARTDEVCFGVKDNFMNYGYLYDMYTFADGTPFGIKEEDKA